jgi:hypothetical protein
MVKFFVVRSPLRDRRTGCPPGSRPVPFQGSEVFDQLHGTHVLHHLEAELRLDAQTARRAVRNRKTLAVHLVGQDRLRVARQFEIDRLVVRLARLMFVEGVEHDVLRVGEGLACSQEIGEGDTRPGGNSGPSLDAMVLGDLGSRRHRPQIDQRKRQRSFDQSAHLEPPVRRRNSRSGGTFGGERISVIKAAENGGVAVSSREVAARAGASQRAPAGG